MADLFNQSAGLQLQELNLIIHRCWTRSLEQHTNPPTSF